MKADACDIRKGLRESVAGKWAGDEDLGDKTLEELFAEYRKRCAFVKNLEIRNRDKMKEDCEILLSSVNKDGEFLASGEKEARIAYEKALERTNFSENSMMELSWQHIGFVELQKTLEKVQATLSFISTSIILGDDATLLCLNFHCVIINCQRYAELSIIIVKVILLAYELPLNV